MTKCIVALVDNVLIQPTIASAAASFGYSVEFIGPTNDLIADLVARQPALILVDLSVRTTDWEPWVMMVKANAATRRMPILAFGPHLDKALLDRARRAGCDAVLSNGAFLADPASAIAQHARPNEREQLSQQAQQPLPALALQAIAQFNRGEFWEQHETFEHVWREEPGPVRQMYQGILQVGVAYYQIQRRNYVGARRLFQRAWQYLVALPDTCQGVDIAQLRADAQAAQAELERLGPERIAEFDPALLKPIRLVK
jgi:predicted metal-dependent hydrolase/CheY-like chemotaxis protein